jgi:DNA-binding PadR family transcriptional regulator
MALKFAVLGLLADSPQTGYELQKSLDQSVGHFWQARFQQTYGELRRLEADGLVERREVPRGGGRKKVYAVTRAGEAALDAWLDSPSALSPIRDEFLVKVARWDRLSGERALTRLRQYRHLQEERLAGYRAIEAHLAGAGVTERALPDPILGRYFALRFGIACVERILGWCDWAASMLEARGVPRAATRAPSRGAARSSRARVAGTARRRARRRASPAPARRD